MSDDGDYPPEQNKSEKEVLFKKLTSYKIVDEDFTTEKRRLNLIAVSNKFGCTIVASKHGFKGYKSQDLVNSASTPQCQFQVSLQSSPCWVAVSSDNLSLVVCTCLANHSLQALFFDMRHLLNSAKSTKLAFADIELASKEENISISDLHWNPSQDPNFYKYLAICLSSGAFYMLTIEDEVKIHAQKPASFGASAACWSPKGKQVMVGKVDGSLQQLTPALEQKRLVPAWDALDRKVRVSDVLWLSTYQVALTYTAVPTESHSFDSPNLLVVKLPSNKEVGKKPQWQLYEDPVYGTSRECLPRSYMLHLDQWNLFAYLTSTSAETSLIGKDVEKNLYEIWALDEHCQLRLPYQEGQGDYTDETWVVGSAFNLNHEKHFLVVGDNPKDHGSMPVLTILSSDGQLHHYHLANMLPNFPCLHQQTQQIDVSGERAVKQHVKQQQEVKAEVPQQPLKVAPVVKETLTAKPSVKPSSSLFGGTKTASPFKLPTPAVKTSLFEKPEAPKVAVAAKNEPPKPLFVTSSLFGGKPATPIAPKQAEFKPAPVVSAPIKVEPAAPAKSLFPVTPAVPAPSAGNSVVKPQAVQPQAVKIQTKPQVVKPPVPSLSVTPAPKAKPAKSQIEARSELAAEIRKQADDFDKELAKFLAGGDIVKKEIESLGTNKFRLDHNAEVNKLAMFDREMDSTMRDQSDDICQLNHSCMQLFSSLKSHSNNVARQRDNKFREAMLSRPLDVNDQKSMKEIRNLYTYVRDSVKEADAKLNDQWQEFISKTKKSKKQKEIEGRESLHKAIMNQTNILHGQETKLTNISQKLDRLRIQRTTGLSSYYSSKTSVKIEKEIEKANESVSNMTLNKDVVTSQSILTSQRTPPQQSRKRNLNVTSHSSSGRRNNELANWLAARTRTPVRTTVRKYKNTLSSTSLMFTKLHSDDDKVEKEKCSITTSSPIQSQSSHYSLNTESESGSFIDTAGLKFETKEGDDSFFSESSQVSQEQAASIKPTSQSPQPGAAFKSLIGSSTITYGAPDQPKHQTPSIMFDSNAGYKEAASNLNNPPLVVNVKNLKENPPIANQPKIPEFSPQFKPTNADVPAEVANEVQKVLNTVANEKKSSSVAPFAEPKTDLSTTTKFSPLASIAENKPAEDTSTSKGLFGSFSLPSSTTSKSTGGFSLKTEDATKKSPFTFSLQTPDKKVNPPEEKPTGAFSFSAPAPIVTGVSKNLFGASTELATDPRLKQNDVTEVSDDVTKGKDDVTDDAGAKPQIEELPALAVDDVTSFLNNAISTPPPEISEVSHPPVVSQEKLPEVKTETPPAEETPAPPVVEEKVSLENVDPKPESLSAETKSTIFGTTSTFGASPATTAAQTFGAPATFGGSQDTSLSFGSLAAKDNSAFGAATTTPSGFGISSTASTGGFGSTTPSVFGTSTTASSGFGVTTTTSSVFGAATTSSSGFGAATKASVFGSSTTAPSSASTFGSSSNVFGAAATTASTGLFGSTTSNTTGFGTTSGSIFGSSAPSTGPFGSTTSTSAASNPFGSSTASPFGSTNTSSSVFGNKENSEGMATESTSSNIFGNSQPAKSPFGNTTSSGFGSSTFGSSSGGFMSGLGGQPSNNQSNNSNPFGSSNNNAASQESKSIFGASASSPFGKSTFGSSSFGQASTQGSGPFSGGTQNSSGPFSGGGQSAFGSGAQSGGFGAAATFGSPSAFGTKPQQQGSGFGGAATFGGGATFGSSANQNATFGSAASFGGTATFGGSSGFGQSSGFGGNTSSGGGFGSFASNQSGGGGFADLANNQSSGGFGSNNQSTNVFGSSNTPKSPSFSQWR